MDRSTRTLLVVGLLVAVVVGSVVSQFASDDPDGLEYVAEQQGFADTVEDHDLAESPLADYGSGLTGMRGLDTFIAGLIGVLATLAAGWGVFWLVSRRSRGSGTGPGGGEPEAGGGRPEA